MEFIPSDPYSIGMELELQLLDANTLDLVDGILPLIEFYPNSPYVKPEFIQNTVEVASKICRSLPELEAHVTSLVADIKRRCLELGMTLCGAGTHPFNNRLALITPLPRYRRMEKATGYLGPHQITFATHVHIGMSSGDDAVTLMRELKAYLPLLIALSASSPFWRGYDTQYASYRHRILASSRSYGIPPSFDSWHSFTKFLETSQHAGVFRSVNDIHWDIRPRPLLGTLEMRVMDAQATVAEAVALVGFVRTLVFYLRRTPSNKRPQHFPQPLPWWLEKENHFQASRLGLAAQFIEDEQGNHCPLQDLFGLVADTVSATADDLAQGSYIEQLRSVARTGLSYSRQRRLFERTASLPQVVTSLVETLEQGAAESYDIQSENMK